jgi:hypothetical protein
MELNQIVTAAQAIVGCQTIVAGIEEIYIVPIGDGFESLFRGVTVTEFPNITQTAIKIEADFQTAKFTSKEKLNDSGRYFENTLTFRLSRPLASWLYEHRDVKFWLMLKKGSEWIISGGDDMPYYLSQDFSSGKSVGDENGFDVEFASNQLRPFFIYEPKIVTLNSTDWSVVGPFYGEWSENQTWVSNDWVTYEGQLYFFSGQESTPYPPNIGDWSTVGDFKGAWNAGKFSIGDLVYLNSQLFDNQTGDNQYTTNVPN